MSEEQEQATDVTAQETKEEAVAIATQPEVPPLMASNLPTFLGELKEHCITICLDTSGSMYNVLDAVKEHVVEALLQKASKDDQAMFNIIEFSSSVTQWADRLVRCTPETVAVAAQWVKALQAKTGTDTLDALLTAFADPVCQAVYLVTDGLPDQETSDILDHMAYAADARPVHCFYIQGKEDSVAATTFLQDLATETYGSFHVIKVAQHGAIERVTPVYRAEAAPVPEVLRTTSGAIYTNDKLCTMTTTLDAEPAVEVVNPSVVVAAPPAVIPAPIHYYPPFHPFRYYYPYHGWSRYRPARAWGKLTEQMVAAAGDYPVAPGAGVMLVGQKVLARRHDDGFFYLGSVKSQLQDEKFLVELGPCKHGRYKDSVFQETYVFDIISHADALRHTVLTGDKVLAPTEPDGERYAPGVVIEGQEKRYAEGSADDKDLTVTFHSGKTEKIPPNKAVWIHASLHDRVTFELQLPAKVRRQLATQDRYPEENLPGYPTSAAAADPKDFDKYAPVYVEKAGGAGVEKGLYKSIHAPYLPLYPTYFGVGARPSVVTSDEIDKIIPGTDLTKSQLNEKVMSQLMQHKLTLDGSTRDLLEATTDDQRLLKRRRQLAENSLHKQDSVKSVTFQDLSDAEAEADPEDLDTRDSGHGSGSDQRYDSDDLDLDLEEDKPSTRDIGVGTSRRLLYGRRHRRSRSKSPDKRPPWRYWKNDPAPDIIDPPTFDPYDYSAPPVPIEVREKLMGKYGVEWTSSGSKVVDPFAKYRHDVSIRDSLHVPKPPERQPEPQGPGVDISELLGSRMTDKARREELRRDFRRRMVLRRQKEWNEKLAEELNQQQQMDEQKAGVVTDRLERHRARVADEHERMQMREQAKRDLCRQLNDRINDYADRNVDREQRRIEALRALRASREAAYLQRQQEEEEAKARRQFLRESHAQDLWRRHQQHLNQEDTQQQLRDLQHQRAKVNRINYYRQLEAEGQRMKGLRADVADQQAGILRSRVLP